eukprot:SAG11_NODE_2481_length_3305_cov_2.704304_4_plen_152_part_00
MLEKVHTGGSESAESFKYAAHSRQPSVTKPRAHHCPQNIKTVSKISKHLRRHTIADRSRDDQRPRNTLRPCDVYTAVRCAERPYGVQTQASDFCLLCLFFFYEEERADCATRIIIYGFVWCAYCARQAHVDRWCGVRRASTRPRSAPCGPA